MEAIAMMHNVGTQAGASWRTCKPDLLSLGFADSSHLRYYSSRGKNRYIPASGSGFFEMKVASDESVADVIRQLEELQGRVKSKKQGQRKGGTMKAKTKSKSCKADSSSSSSSESSSDEGDSDVNMELTRVQAQTRTGRAVTQAQAQVQTRKMRGLEAVTLGSLCTKVEVCTGGKCRKNGSQQVLAAFQDKAGCVAAVACKCMGKCDRGPNVRVGSVVYGGVAPQNVEGLLQQQGKQESYCYL